MRQLGIAFAALCLAVSAVGCSTKKSDACAGVICAAGDSCHVAGACDPATGRCTNPPAADGSACDDGNKCTRTDTCQAGVCVGGNPVTCTAADACKTAGTCNPATGLCGSVNVADGTSCSTDKCALASCTAGSCVPRGAACCDDGNSCTADSCDPATGCKHTALADNVACADPRIYCPGGATKCQAGACACLVTGTNLQVIVAERSGRPLANAAVSLNGAAPQAADASGRVLFTGVAGPSAVIVATAPGFSDNGTRITIPAAAELSRTLALAPVDFADTIGAGSYLYLTNRSLYAGDDLDAVTTSAPAGSIFVDAAGAAVTGNVTVEVVNVDPTSERVALAPQPFVAGSPAAPFQPLSIAEVRATSGGQPVFIKAGQTLNVTLRQAARFQPGITRIATTGSPFYRWDPATGAWVFEVFGGPVSDPLAGSQTPLQAFTASVSHLGWIAVADRTPAPPTACVNVHVVRDQDGAALANTLVTSFGASYPGITSAETDATGATCLALPTGAIASLVAEDPTYSLQAGGPKTVSVSATASACGSGCQDVTLRLSAASCVSGKVVSSTNAAAPGVSVTATYGSSYAVRGGTAVTDSSGSFTLVAPAPASVQVAASDSSRNIVQVNVATAQQPSACNTPCADAGTLVLRPRQKQTCVRGRVFAFVDGGPNGLADAGTPVFAYNQTNQVSCAPGGSSPQTWGNIVAQTTIGPDGRYCLDIALPQDGGTGVPYRLTIVPADCAIRGKLGPYADACQQAGVSPAWPDDGRSCDEGNCIDVGDNDFFYGCS